MTSILSSSLQRKLGAKLSSFSAQQRMPTFAASASTLLLETQNIVTNSSTTNLIKLRQFSVKVKQPKKEGKETTKKSIRLIPTRHSRHHKPPAAPVDVLDNATDNILNSIPGTLFGMSSFVIKLL